MSSNGQPPQPSSLQGRIDPGRVRQLEQQTQLQAAILVSRALADLNNLSNTLHFLTEQATAGNPTARAALKLWFDNCDQAKAAAAGIVVSRDQPRKVD